MLAGVPDETSTPAETALDAISTRVDAAPRVPFEWLPPSGTPPLADGCEQFVPETELSAVFRVQEVLIWDRPAGGWSLDAATWQGLGAWPCLVSYADRDGGVGAHVKWLPGGEWAWKLAAPSGETVELPGVDDGKLECLGAYCTVDLLVRGNWIQIATVNGDHDSAAARATVLPFAARVADELT